MATYSPESLYRKINDVQEIFGGLSQTSQFMVSLNLGSSTSFAPRTRLNDYLRNCGLFENTRSTAETYDFLCSEATLPGSSFDMTEEQGTRQGIIERFPIRRLYADFDLTFYVDREYNTIRLFEEWMNWIDPLHTGTSVYEGDEDGQVGYEDGSNFYRFRYPNDYKTKVTILKFERGFIEKPNDVNSKLLRQPLLKYDFIDAFPMNITALPLSYDNTDITRISINFSYSRYTVSKQNVY